MAIVAENDMLFGLRGRVGALVFRHVHGKTVVSRRPVRQDPQKQTAAQKQTRSVFKEAAAWAKRILDDPQQRKYYTQCAKEWQLTNAYIAAVKDYMRNPALRKETLLPFARRVRTSCVVVAEVKTNLTSAYTQEHPAPVPLETRLIHNVTYWRDRQSENNTICIAADGPTNKSPVFCTIDSS